MGSFPWTYASSFHPHSDHADAYKHSMRERDAVPQQLPSSAHEWVE